MADLRIGNHGSIYLLHAESELGSGWIAEHIPDDAMTFGSAIVVEHRYIGAIVEGAMNDGLEVE